MGNTLVVKPAEDASLTTLRMAELALEAGFPDGVVQRRHRATAARPARRWPPIRGVDYISFTGSPRDRHGDPAGGGASTNPACTLELGGKSPQIVFADADLDAALPVLVNAVIQNGGQTCSAGSRILVERPVYDACRGAAGRALRGAASPARTTPTSTSAPLINARQKDARRSASSRRARRAASPVLARRPASPPDAPAGGYYRRAGAVRRRSPPDARAGAGGGVRAGAGADCRSTTKPRRSRLANGTRLRPRRRRLDRGRRRASMRVAKRAARRPGVRQRLRRRRRHRAAVRRRQASPATAARRASRRSTTSRRPRRSSFNHG